MDRQKLIFDTVLNTICEFYEIDFAVMSSKTRKREVAQPRQMAMTMVHDIDSSISTSRIGRLFNRDHATCLHAEKIINGLIDVDKQVRSDYNEIKEMVFERMNKKINNSEFKPLMRMIYG